MPKLGQQITTYLWFDDQALPAARFYTSLFLGRGKRLFNETSQTNLKLAESKTFGTGVVKLVYQRADER